MPDVPLPDPAPLEAVWRTAMRDIAGILVPGNPSRGFMAAKPVLNVMGRAAADGRRPTSPICLPAS